MEQAKEPSQAIKQARERLTKEKGVWIVIYVDDGEKICTFKTASKSELEAGLLKIIPAAKTYEVFRGAKPVEVKTRLAVDLIL